MSNGGLYEKVLTGLGAVQGTPARPPRASASVVLWRRDDDGELEVFWVRRAPELKFMGGWYAFPGGAVEKGDSGVAVESRPSGVDEAPVDGGMPAEFLAEALPLPEALAPGVVAAALRELFEETGVTHGIGPRAADLEGIRRRTIEERRSSAAALVEAGVVFDASPLVYAGRWLTPPLGPVRFDNRFFLLEWPAGRDVEPRVVPGELASGEWVRPAEALARWRSGQVLAAPPILHILHVLAEDGPVEGLPRLCDASEANVVSFRRVEFVPGMLAFPLATPTLPPATHTNAYLLGFGECVLVDPGSPDPQEQRRLLEALAHLESGEGRRVVEIWLTHHHLDHVGGVAQAAGELDVPVLAHARTARRLTDLGVSVRGELEEGVERRLQGPEPMTLRVLHTPGHTRGHLCFLDAERGSLAAGDLVSAVSTIVVDPPDGDMDDYLASLERLRAMPLAALLPAHGPAVPEPARYLAELIEHRLWREERILDAWRGGRTDPQAMLPTVYDDVPELAWPLAARQIEAHLERLRRAGRLPEV
ncbi:MAG: MBL fold metallo-hydrolase [Thermoanaerobaculia bacterium]